MPKDCKYCNQIIPTKQFGEHIKEHKLQHSLSILGQAQQELQGQTSRASQSHVPPTFLVHDEYHLPEVEEPPTENSQLDIEYNENDPFQLEDSPFQLEDSPFQLEDGPFHLEAGPFHDRAEYGPIPEQQSKE
jgi:hypothetical protein